MAEIHETRVMVFGTFDLLHPGHEHFFRQAKGLAKKCHLIVSVARDVNVKKIKGKKPLLSENTRKELVEKLDMVDKAVLGGKLNYLTHIIKENPHIIALGYDQSAYTETLTKDLRQAGLKVKIVRLRPHKPHIYKSSKIRANLTGNNALKTKKMGTFYRSVGNQ